jgi:hypothetical protein
MRHITATIFSICMLFGGVASADVIDLDSHAGLTTSLPGITTVAITPDPLWQPNNPQNPGDPNDTSAVWISNGLSGYGDSQFQPYEGTTPVVTVFQDFVSGPGLLNLDVWADDTADVILDGNYLAYAKFTQSICSGQPIGCRPQDDGVLTSYLSGGSHQLEFVLYQVGTGTDTYSNPFGLLYTGTAVAPVPEPASFVPLVCALIGLGFAYWKKRNSQNHEPWEHETEARS